MKHESTAMLQQCLQTMNRQKTLGEIIGLAFLIREYNSYKSYIYENVHILNEGK